MRNVLLILFTVVFELSANDSYSQSTKLTLDLNNVTVANVFEKIEESSDFYFLYNAKLIDVNREVSIKVENEKISDILDKLLSGTGVNYKLVDKLIILTPNESEAQTETAMQQLKITGKVTDASTGEALPGVNIMIKGTSTGVLTGIDGVYSLTVPDKNATLAFSFIGYASLEFQLNGRTTIDVVLQPITMGLEEVIVIGYGTQKKLTSTGAVSMVKGDEIRRSPANNLTNKLVGSLPGLMGVTRSGEPGADASTLRIRGLNTLGDNTPLTIVDGIADRDITRIDPSDIQSISVLKDASAAIYGARAANGVILVTTKRGALGKPKVEINMSTGIQQPTVIPKMADAATYVTMLNEIEYYRTPSKGRFQRYSADDIQKYSDGSDPWGHPNTDWFKETFKPYSSQNYGNVAISGGTENIKYFVSLGARNEDGVYKKSATNYAYYDFRSNIDAKISKNISFSFDLKGSQENKDFAVKGVGSIFRSIVRGKPNAPAYWPDGNPGPSFLEFGDQPVVTATAAPGYNKDYFYSLETNSRIDITIPWVKGLAIQGNVSIDKGFETNKIWTKPWFLYTWDGNADHITVPGKVGVVSPSLTQTNSNNDRYTLNTFATYSNTILANHNIKLMVGAERLNGNTSYVSGFRRDYISTELDQLFAGASNVLMTSTGSATSYARMNYFGRMNYDYMQKYLVEFVFRYDGSYIFPSSKRFGFFPGISGGWRISEENFWKNNIKFINNFKLRASWGRTGNDRINEFQYLSTYAFSSSSTVRYYYNVNIESMVLSESRIPNPNVTWEVANQSNFGFNAQLLNNKLSIEADYFSNLRSNILTQRNASVPSSSGLTLPPENIGKVSNRGWEAIVGYQDQIGAFRFNVSLGGNYAKNKILFWDETPGVPEYQQSTGKPMGTDLFYNSLGVFEDQAAVDAYPHWSGAVPGDVIFEDVNNDGKIDGLDKVRRNKTNFPTFIGTFNLNMSYKGFDLTILFQGATGAEQNIQVEGGQTGNVYRDWAVNRWTPENPSTTFVRSWDYQAPYWDKAGNNNTYWLYQTDYLRLKNFEIGYSFTKIKVIGIEGLRIYANGSNIFTMSNNKLIDPELTAANSYPLQRILNTGLTITF